MTEFINRAKELILGINLYGVLDILMISLLFYLTFRFLLKNNSSTVIKVFILIILAAVLAAVGGLSVSGTLLRYFFLTGYLAMVVIYSQEIRRHSWSHAKKLYSDKYSDSSVTEEELKVCTDEVVKAVQNMAKKDIGALIVFIKGHPPSGILESGVMLNSTISSQLVESIFIPKSPLHDGAMLIKDNKILAAGCFLPLSLEVNLPKEFGTRHRAAIGITETHNVMAVVVSEETGIISVANDGQLKRYIDGEMLKSAIESAYGLSDKALPKWHRKNRGQ